MKTEAQVFDEFIKLKGAVFVGQEVCDHKRLCNCYNNCRQAEITYKNTKITILENRDGLHVAFGVLQEYPPEASDIIDVERLIRVIKDGK